MTITNDIKYVGVNDHEIDLFEGQYVVPLGMAYNSYLIIDNEIAIMDSVDKNFKDEWLLNIEKELKGKLPSYLVISHMEPDHSANIKVFMDKYKDAIIVSTQMAFNMMKAYFNTDFSERKIVVKENDTLSLGKHELRFITAPFVHWPEVMFTYDNYDKVLFSADAFGKFGANDKIDPEGWACEARRYYFGIVGKFGQNVQNVLKKLEGLEIKTICSLHGPVLNEDLDYYLNIYNIWSSYQSEASAVTIAYTSVYGNTKEAVLLLKEKLEEKNIEVALHDLARDDMPEALESAFENDRLVLATTTYNGGMFPTMETFINELKGHNYQNRKIAFIENGSWAPSAIKAMKSSLEGLKDITFLNSNVSIKGSLKDENIEQINKLVQELSN